MGISCRIFIVDPEDRVHRFTSTDFTRLYEDPESFPIPRFANQRLRVAEAVVELKNRRPMRVLRLAYFLFPFDERGVLDRADVDRRQLAHLNDLFDHRGAVAAASSDVLDKRHRFTVQGGKWSPGPQLLEELTSAALGKRSCGRFSL